MNNERIKNYYKILNINRTASKEEVKSAYRKLAKTLHPDINKAPNAKEQFQEISEAYEILYNDESRKEYDDLILSCMKKSSDVYQKYNDFRSYEQKEAKKKAETYAEMSLEEVLKIIADTLLHGEKAARPEINMKVYHLLGLRVLLCCGLISLMGTVILTIPALYLILYATKGFFYNGKFVGIVPVIKGFAIVFAEFMTICIIIFWIQFFLGVI